MTAMRVLKDKNGFVGPLVYFPNQADYTRALELACIYYNRCQELEEIIEMFCMDAEKETT